MKTALWTLVTVLIGALAGTLLGKATHPEAVVPPAPAELPGVEPEPSQGQAQPLFAEATPASSPAAPAPIPAAADTADSPAVAATAPTAVLVIPHGPGRFATLDLQAAELSQLSVYQGTLLRDGLANPASISRAAKIATLRGPEPKVELLHLGFDRDAQPIAAHVRLAEGPAAGQEGLVLLRVTRKGQPDAAVQVRPIASAPEQAEPVPDAPPL